MQGSGLNHPPYMGVKRRTDVRYPDVEGCFQMNENGLTRTFFAVKH
jgi:hypothetical protein